MDEVAPALTGADLLHLDGQCFVGAPGVLGVALRVNSLAHLRRTGAATHWLLPVEDVAVVAAAANLPGPILWLSLQPPARVVGHLAEDFQGAWLDGNLIVIKVAGVRCQMRLAQPLHRSFARSYLARLVANLWTAKPSVDAAISPLRSIQPAELIAA